MKKHGTVLLSAYVFYSLDRFSEILQERKDKNSED